MMHFLNFELDGIVTWNRMENHELSEKCPPWVHCSSDQIHLRPYQVILDIQSVKIPCKNPTMKGQKRFYFHVLRC